MDVDVRLRPIEEHDLALLARFEWDPQATGEYFRAGRWRDGVNYGLLRGDQPRSRSNPRSGC